MNASRSWRGGRSRFKRTGWLWALMVLAFALALWVRRKPPALLILFGEDTWTRIQREGGFRVGMDASYPPFEQVDDQGRFYGLDVDLVTELGRVWGLSPQFVNIHFDGLYDALKMGKIDLIVSALPFDRTMTRDVNYSQSYFNAGQVLLVSSDDARIQTLADLQGRRVAVELGSEAHLVARQLARDSVSALEIVTAYEPEEVVTLLGEGSADALICDRVTAEGLIPTQNLRLVGSPLTDEPYVMASRRDSRALISHVDAALETWRASGLIDELERRWF